MLVENWYAAVDAEGFVAQFESAIEDSDGPAVPISGTYIYRKLPGLPPTTSQPTAHHVMTWPDGAAAPDWSDQRTIEECKAEKNAEINQKRLLANRTSFPFAGKSIACDELSMLDIQSLNGIVALIGDLPPGFANQWKAIDNTYVAIPDKSTWIAFIGAMVSTGQANFDHSQALKLALAEATTNTDVDAITWE